MIALLQQLIAAESISRNEDATAGILHRWLADHGIVPRRHLNNIWALSEHFDPSLPTLLLNSHHDTVRPTNGWTRHPFTPAIEQGKLYGLGSNDAGGSLVALISTFHTFHRQKLRFNLMLALTAEEEVSGTDGMEAMARLWADQGISPAMGIIGEPTRMQAAIGERGLVVIDCVATARGGHAARNEGENALYKALDDINALRSMQLPLSPVLGPIKVTATQIQAGTQHNVLPQECRFVLDVRTTDALTNLQTVEAIASGRHSTMTPRSLRLNASTIEDGHPLVRAALAAGASTFVSPTMSDMALLPGIPTLKIGPGDSSRSHTPDEYIRLDEIESGIETYKRIILNLNEIMGQGL